MARRIGMLIFPRLTQLDMTGPYQQRDAQLARFAAEVRPLL